MDSSTSKPNKAMKSGTLFVIGIIAFVAGAIIGSETALGSGIGLIGVITLLMAIIAFVRERRAPKNARPF